MILDNGLISTLFVSVLPHAGLLFVMFFRHTKSQLSDYEEIQLDVSKLSVITLGTFVNTPLTRNPPNDFRGLLACYFRGIAVLRVLALGPSCFYVVAILCYVLYLQEAQLADGFSVIVLGHWLLGLGVGLHISYVAWKVRTGIMEHLKSHHPKYDKKKVGAVSLWTDFYPTVLGYKE